MTTEKKSFDLGDIVFERDEGNQQYASGIGSFKSPNTTIRAYVFPLCCTGAVLACFGGSGDGYIYDGDSPDDLKNQIEAWVEAIRIYGKVFPQVKEFICASTTSEQEEANAALESLGFECSKLMVNNKNNYPLYTWTLALSGYEEEGEGSSVD